MKHFKSLLAFLLLTIPLSSFNDFVDYWTVKLNGNIIYDSNNDKNTGANKIYQFKVQSNKITSNDTIEIQYFKDAPCDCLYNYSIAEYSLDSGRFLGNIYKDQNTSLLQSYKVPLLDILNNNSTEGTFKIVFFAENQDPPRPLCRIDFE